jgi:Nucleotidyl transferase AbiEii toxin, Type IV TA system
MNRDFVEMLSELSAAGAEFLVVGAHALAAHGVPRATGDIDIWVRGSPENADRVLSALTRFGAPLFDLRREDLTRPGTVFQIGQPPSRIDILSSISGVAFEAAWPRRLLVEIEGVAVPVLAREDFIANKRAAGRAKDLSDLALLSEAAGPLEGPG